MSLERSIAFVFLIICAVYGYAAFFTMDGALPPFMRQNPIWPSTFPKILSVAGILISLTILFNIEKSDHTAKKAEINYRRLTEYKLGQALLLIGLMVVYALALRPVGFLLSTSLFLLFGFTLLGERRWWMMILVSVITAGIVWYLVDNLLGIYLRPWPSLFMGS